MASRVATSRFELKLSREQKARWFAAASRKLTGVELLDPSQ